jgi:hypothetical protein
VPDEHYLLRDTPLEQARAVLNLLRDSSLRLSLAVRARDCVERRFGYRVAAEAFEQICLRAVQQHRTARSLVEEAVA